MTAKESKATDQELTFVDRFGWKPIMQFNEELLMAQHLRPPSGSIDELHFLELLLRKFETVPFDILVERNPADR